MNLRIFLLGFIIFALLGSWAGSCMLYRAAELGEQVAPISPRKFAPLEIVAVGTGNEYENPARRGPSTAIGSGDQVVLVDAGRAVTDALRLSAIPVEQPSTVYLTNLMPVNTAGLDELVIVGWLRGRTQPLQVIGPQGTARYVENLIHALGPSAGALGRALELPERGFLIAVREAEDGFVAQHGDLEVRAGALTGGPLPALAWRFSAEGRSAVVSGTGWGADQLVDLARGADFLVHESVFIPVGAEAEEAGVTENLPRLEREAAIHTSLRDVGKIAARAGVTVLVLVRLQPPPFFELQLTGPISEDFAGQIVIPDDGETVYP